MLIDEPLVMRVDPILAVVAAVNGRSARVTRLREGVYQRGDWGSSEFLRDTHEPYPDVSVGPYGVCDSVDQIMDKCPELSAPDRMFTVIVTPVRREDQSPEGGWRWHKWGEYIGTQNPQHEYLYDDTHIDEVLCFHIYERK